VSAEAGQPDVDEHDEQDVEPSTTAQMEWDPQTDVASPMLALQGKRNPIADVKRT